VDELQKHDCEREDDILERVGIAVHSSVVQHLGRVEVASRASLDAEPEFAMADNGDLPLEKRRQLEQMMRSQLKQNPVAKSRRTSPDASETEDQLDAACAAEVLGKLPKMVQRLSSLDGMDSKPIANEDVRHYFDEAHRCFLYGFGAACAVMCRAILWSGLKDRFDPKGSIEKSLKGKSYFKALVARAKDIGILTDDRPDWAEKIKKAGDDAAHNYGQFHKNWLGKMDEVLLNTRKVLIDLYVDAHEG
jgi:hypothetical protein